MVFYQQIFFLDQCLGGFFRRREVILDQLKDIRKRGQRKHQHHQAADTGRGIDDVGGILEMMQKIAVKQILAVLLQAQHGVNLAARFFRQDAADKLHIRRRHFHIDHEVGAGKRKQHRDLHGVKQHRI